MALWDMEKMVSNIIHYVYCRTKGRFKIYNLKWGQWEYHIDYVLLLGYHKNAEEYTTWIVDYVFENDTFSFTLLKRENRG